MRVNRESLSLLKEKQVLIFVPLTGYLRKLSRSAPMPFTTALINPAEFQMGRNVVVVDAGGGTIDVSAYVVEKVVPLAVKEIFAPECTPHAFV